MKKYIILLSAVAFLFVLAGAGCAPKAAEQGTQKTGAAKETVQTSTQKSNTGVTQEDLDNLKKNINSLDIQDLSEIKS